MTTHATDWNGLTLAGGRYKITAKLGEGGMGSVYRALDQNIDAEVVIKVPRQAMMEDPDFAGRFTREIRSLVKLSHPHIVKVSDVGSFEGTPFAVMQFLPGGTLDDHRPVGPDGQPLPADPKKVPRWLIGRRRGARLRPHAGIRPPRRQARQHPVRRRGARLPERFRRGQGPGLLTRDEEHANGDDRRRDGAGHARIHGTRADHGRAVRRPG